MIRSKLRHKRVLNSRILIRTWSHRLEGIPGFILGNALSINDIAIHKLDNFFTIGINRIFLKQNFDPTILMWQDIELWLTEREKILKLKAIKYARDTADPRRIGYSFKLGNGPFKVPTSASVLYGRGATAPLAFQLAYVLGCNPIVLVGCDCCYQGGETNFYGKNRFHKQHTLRNCNRGLRWIRDCQKERTIINCSNNSVFSERENFDDVIKRLAHHAKNRAFYSQLLTKNK